MSDITSFDCPYKRQPEKFVSKGWGYESWIVNKDEYCGKLLFFKKGRRCSWHHHKDKDETFYIQEGVLKVWYSFDDELPAPNLDNVGLPGEERGIVFLRAGDCFHVPVGMRHQMEGISDTVMFEFSTTHRDEDSYRIIKGD